MALCPSGHQSQTTDYCDTCGAVMGGAPVTPASASAAPSGAGPAAAASGGAGGSCPQCGAERGGRFCEECGYDYELAELVPPVPEAAAPSEPAGSSAAPESPDPLAETVAAPPDYDFDAEFAAAERAFAASQGSPSPAESNGAAPEPATPDVSTPTPAAEPALTPSSVPAPATVSTALLTAVVTVDREYYDAQVDRGDIVPDEFPFPKYPDERRFSLDGDRVRIGRASASRGLAVEIDLTGPPLDPAVSHLHAQLLRGGDGGWSVVDLNSANGTRLNGAQDPLPAETEVPVKAGDRIHLGVWTTVTLEEA